MKLSISALRAIGCVSMLFDHIGAVLFPQALWMRALGRLAFPIFAFLLTEGVARTRSPLRYLLRLAAMAAVSEFPFDLASSGRIDWVRQNAVFTLLCGCALLLWLACGKGTPEAALFAACLAAETMRADYGFIGVLLIDALWRTRRMGEGPARAVALFAALEASLPLLDGLLSGDLSAQLPWVAVNLCSLAAIPLLAGSVPGEDRPTRLSARAGYLFYPLHLAVLALLAR